VTDEQLRALVRETIARHVDRQVPTDQTALAASFDRRHASQWLFTLTEVSDDDGACLIEPAVRCNHCGYCLSFGH
jgi:hypothetical protein